MDAEPIDARTFFTLRARRAQDEVVLRCGEATITLSPRRQGRGARHARRQHRQRHEPHPRRGGADQLELQGTAVAASHQMQVGGLESLCRPGQFEALNDPVILSPLSKVISKEPA
jgi:hypothetical protein